MRRDPHSWAGLRHIGAESWPELGEEALKLLEQLGSLDGAVVFKARDLPSILPIDKPRRVGDIQGALYQQLGGVNQVAERAGINSVITGGWGPDCASRAALLVKQHAAGNSNVTAARVSGVIEIVAFDQLRVDRGDSIQTILSDSNKLNAVQPAFQQVFPLAS